MKLSQKQKDALRFTHEKHHINTLKSLAKRGWISLFHDGTYRLNDNGHAVIVGLRFKQLDDLYVIAWRSTFTGRAGHGSEKLSRFEAEKIALAYNLKQPGIEHWIVPVI